jgi:signal transduction histidine kinase
MTKITQLADIIRDMLSMRELDTQHLDYAEARVEHIVETAIHNHLALAVQAGLTVKPTLSPQVSPVWVDAPRIIQVVEHLIDNAIKFSPQDGRKANQIDVRVEDNGGAMVRITVHDYGIGIPQAEFENIFQRGYQVDGSMTRRFGGAGLGLSLARQIVEAHGGKIWVESSLGTGSQFIFTIPKIGVKFDRQLAGRQHGDV